MSAPARFRTAATRLVGRFGQPVTFRRQGPPDKSSYPPVPGPVTDTTVVAAVTPFSSRDRDGINITDRDVTLYIDSPSGYEPEISDKVEINGQWFVVQSVTRHTDKGGLVAFEVVARAGE